MESSTLAVRPASVDDISRPPAYLIINSFSSRNAGDAAIVLGTAALLRDARPARVTNASRHYAEDAGFYGSTM